MEEPENTGSVPEDLAPDADEPGDELPAELEPEVHDDVHDVDEPDQVDQQEVQE